MGEGSWVGLDVHARSVVAGVIDVGSGEVRSLRVPPGNDATVAWLKTLPTPRRVVYAHCGANHPCTLDRPHFR